MTDLFTKPTDTHQLLHRASCHPNHTKKGIPYSQALRIRRICSEEQFFSNRVADLKTWLLARGYGENEVDSQSTDQAPDNYAKHISSLYELFSFKQLIEEPTRATLDTATVIDHVASTCPRNIIKSGVLEVSLSDHYMVYCIRKFNGAVEKGHKKIKIRKMKNFTEEAFLADVSGICWE